MRKKRLSILLAICMMLSGIMISMPVQVMATEKQVMTYDEANQITTGSLINVKFTTSQVWDVQRGSLGGSIYPEEGKQFTVSGFKQSYGIFESIQSDEWDYMMLSYIGEVNLPEDYLSSIGNGPHPVYKVGLYKDDQFKRFVSDKVCCVMGTGEPGFFLDIDGYGTFFSLTELSEESEPVSYIPDKAVVNSNDYFMNYLGLEKNTKTIIYKESNEENSNISTRYEETDTITLSDSIFSREGYRFEGWSDGTKTYLPGESYTIAPGEKVITFVGVWNKLYQVTYDIGEGAIGNPPASVQGVEKESIQLPKADGLSKVNYKFAGWKVNNEVYQPGDTYVIGSENVVFTAVWKKNTSESHPEDSSSSSTTTQTNKEEPVVAGNTSIKGWETIIEFIKGKLVEAEKQDNYLMPTIEINMKGITEIPATLMKSIVGKKVTVSFGFENNVMVLLNGSKLSDENGYINVKTLKQKEITKQQESIGITENSPQIVVSTNNISNETMGLSFDMGKGNVNKNAILYIQDSKGQLEAVKRTIIDEEGRADFEVAKADAHYIVIAKNCDVIQLMIGKETSIVNNKEIQNDVAPKIVDGTTMVPLRFVAENLGVAIKWQEQTKCITIISKGQECSMTIGQKIDGYDIEPVIDNGRTLVPLRYISEVLGAVVIWDKTTKSIEVIK